MILDESQIQEAVDRKMRELLDSARVTHLNPNTPIQRYYRSVLEVHKAALDAFESGVLKKAFVLLVRFCSLTVEELPKHPQNASFGGTEKSIVAELVQSSLIRAEEIKVLVKRMLYNEVIKELESIREEEARASTTMDEVGNADASSSINEKNSSVPTITTQPKSKTSRNESGTLLTVPSDIIDEFMSVAHNNTSRNIETCGVLCGKKMDTGFLITHVILPPQVGTADSCCAEDEMGLFNIQKENSLLTLGWIHTHPTQTAFLSSVDLHTHYGYQSSLDLAIAIVVAPTHQVGTFTLTSEGMQIISQCVDRGFHTHAEVSGPLFVEAQHVSYSSDYKNQKMIENYVNSRTS